ncbi:zn-dependent hydrolases of the beta-lactamase protein [Apiospora arundinis]|uniref:Zn-dependent hydrolases of the beta-lactamase protein n=1 Tax=Apiospora arundinis TaxID=335852 RepID=A0ABR2HZD3_9PEZI
MTSSTFTSSLTITHVGTATAILKLGDVTFITDPYLSPAETSFHAGPGVVLTSHYEPSHTLESLPPIDAVLLSHEDHADNLDPIGRRLLEGRRVLTTMDGARKLAPRPGVVGLKAWETVPLVIGGRHFEVTATPCQHLPGGECNGFIVTAPEFGTTTRDDGVSRPNAIYFSGDTVYLEELTQMRERFHISLALFNIGAAAVMPPGGGGEPLLITMDGKQAARLFREIGADVLVPMHFESWDHFTEGRDGLEEAFRSEGVLEKVVWLELGVPRKVS